MKKKLALAFAALAGLAAFAIMSTLTGFHPPMEMNENLPQLNSGGDQVYASMIINDSTGVVSTPLDAGVYIAITGAPLTVGEDDGSGCITASLSTGKFTIAKRCGVGEVELEACFSNVQGNNTAGTSKATWYKNAAAITNAPIAVKPETVDAGAQGPMSCVKYIDDATTVGDYYTVVVTNPASGTTVTTRGMTATVKKLESK